MHTQLPAQVGITSQLIPRHDRRNASGVRRTLQQTLLPRQRRFSSGHTRRHHLRPSQIAHRVARSPPMSLKRNLTLVPASSLLMLYMR